MRRTAWLFCIGLCLLAGPAAADIHQWEWVDPGDPDQGRQASTTLCPDGLGRHAAPGANLDYLNLTRAYLAGTNLQAASFTGATLAEADLAGASLGGAWCNGADLADAWLTDATLADAYLDNANLSGADLSGVDAWNVSFWHADLAGADFAGAEVRGSSFAYATDYGFTAAQLYATASYATAADLSGLTLTFNDMAGWDLAGLNLGGVVFGWSDLTGASFAGADCAGADFTSTTLAGADFTAAAIGNASLADTTGDGFTAGQLYATASYAAGDLADVLFTDNDLSGWDFSGQDLSRASFQDATLAGADFTGATVRDAWFCRTDLTAAKLYATASYAAGDLAGIRLNEKDLSGWDLANQNLTDADLWGSTLAGADFTGADIRGAWLGHTDLTAAQLYATASYAAGDLEGVEFAGNDLSGWTLAGQHLAGAAFSYATLTAADLAGADLTGANFTQAGLAGADLAGADLTDAYLARADLGGASLADADLAGATLTQADLTGADARGAQHVSPAPDTVTTNLIRPDGTVDGLDLSGGRTLTVRDYDTAPLPVHVAGPMTMGDGTLRLVLDADAWGSEMAFDPGAAVALGGTLDLGFADGVDVAAQAGRTFGLFDWTGVAPTGAFAIDTPHRWDLSALYTAGEVTLLPPPGTVRWTGGAGGTWDLAGSVNWARGGQAGAYYDGDDAVFDSADGGPTLVQMDDTVTPASVLIDNANAAIDFAFIGPGGIAGACGLTKRGVGTAGFSTVNAYTGGTFVDAGTLTVAADGALGTGPVALGATADAADAALLVGSVTVDNPVTVQDDGDPATTRTLGGFHTAGTAVFAGDVTASQDLRLTAEPGGEVRLTGTLDNAAGCTLTKVGGGTVVFGGPQDHGPGSRLEILDGLLVLETDASGTGAMDDAHLSVLVDGAELHFETNQRLDTLEIAGDGLVRLTGANVVVVRHLVLGGLDLGGMTLTPEPATLALLGLGAMWLLRRRRLNGIDSAHS